MKQVQTPYGTFYCLDGDLITRQLEQFGAHTRNELAMLLSVIAPGDMVADVGAHLGTFAIPIAHKLDRSGRVAAFEADLNNFGILEKATDANGLTDRIELVHAIVTDRPGAYTYLAKPENTGAGEYLYAGDQGNAQTYSHCVGLDKALHDAEFPRLDVLKIDVEGMEMAVLCSAMKTIAAWHPVIYLEINVQFLAHQGAAPIDIQKFLVDRGYRIFRNVGARNSAHDRFVVAELQDLPEDPGLYDILCIHSENAQRLAMLGVRAFAQTQAKTADS